MTISQLKNSGFLRAPFATLAAIGLITAASLGLSVRAQAENATAAYVAPLDMTSDYASAFEYPDFLPDALVRRAMADPDTTGVSSTSAAGRKDAAASQQEPQAIADDADDKYNR